MNDNSIIHSDGRIHLGLKEMNVKTKMSNLDELEINNIKIFVKGRFLKTAMVREEWDDDVADPETVINALKRSGVKIDIFTFIVWI